MITNRQVQFGKIRFFSLACCLLLTNAVHSQWYYAGGMGYGFPFATDELASTFSEIGALDIHEDTDGDLSVNRRFGTLGPGFHLSSGAGYQFNRFIALDLDLTFVRSGIIRLANDNSPTYAASHDVYCWRLQFTPQLVLNTGGSKIRGFVKSGLVIPLYGQVKSIIQIHDEEGRVARERFGLDIPGLETDLDVKATTSPRFSYGFRTAIGVEWQLSKRLMWYNELYFTALSIVANQSIITDYNHVSTKDGGAFITENMENITEFLRHTEYLYELTETSNNSEYSANGVNFGLAAEELVFKENFNNAGWITGLRVYIGKLKEYSVSKISGL